MLSASMKTRLHLNDGLPSRKMTKHDHIQIKYMCNCASGPPTQQTAPVSSPLLNHNDTEVSLSEGQGRRRDILWAC